MKSNPEEHPEDLVLLASAVDHFQKDHISQAMHLCRSAIELAPENSDAHNLLALCYKKKENYEKAIQSAQKAVELDPDNTGHLKNLELMYRRNKQYEKAIEICNQAIKLEPQNPLYLFCKAISLSHMWKFEESIEVCKKLLEIDPDYTSGHVVIANNYQELCDHENSLKHFKIAEQLAPTETFATYNKSLLLLQMGDYKNGFKDYLSRWEQGPPLVLPDFVCSKPMWDGKDFSGKGLLIMAEQGMGDTIQFSRYLPEVTKLGTDIKILCFTPLIDILKPLAPNAHWFTKDDPVPLFDTQITMVSFPLVFGTEVDNIPAEIPYLAPTNEKKSEWKKLISDNNKPKIAVNWSGSTLFPKDELRSIPPEKIETILKDDRFDFYLMQKGREEEEAKQFASKYSHIEELGSKINDFSDTAAILSEMDLLITVDTAIAHLAGALGINVWNLLVFNSDWRWLLNREDSPWYPGIMRLFRQNTRADWDSVLNRIQQELNSSPLRGEQQSS